MTKKKDYFELDLSKVFSKFKWTYLILFLMLCFGFYLRFYHIQYPVIGYHNWKTAHYITEARNFAREGFFKYGFFVPMRDSTESISEPLDGQHNDTFPAIGIIVGFLFKIFGESLVVARLANILFSLGSVFLFFLLIKALFEREDLALLCGFLAAINPMYVFFSHNIDVINPGLFFMLLGTLFYVKWIKEQVDNNKFSFLYLASFFIMLASITKYTFVVIVIPVFFSFPFKKILKNLKKAAFPLLIALLIFSGFPMWMAYSEIYVKNNVFGKNFSQDSLDSYDLVNLVDLSMIWNGEFWSIMKSYVTDNYSMIGVFFAFIGSFLFLILYLSKNKNNFGYKFTFWYFISVFIFIFIMGYKLSGHSYHQFPIAPLIIFMIGYFIDVVAANIVIIAAKVFNFSRGKLLIKVAVCVIIIFLIPLPNLALYAKSIEAKNRQFDTQFPGLDIAGNYIRAHANEGDRMFHSSGQSFGVLWHAGIKGYKPPATAEYLKKAEQENNISWIFMYQWGISSYFQNQGVMDYIRNNYRLVEFGFVQVSEQQVQPLFFLFRKGGSFNESNLNSMLQNKPVVNTQYSFSNKKFYEVRSIDLE
jgi:hypothetical protein